MSQPATLVLVHGAMSGPWVWEKVTPLLEAAGVPFVLVDRGFGEPRRVSSDPRVDAERVREAIAEAARSVVLVGHSQGGIGITHGGADNDLVRHLVYITAFVPGLGSTALDASAPELAAAVRPLSDGFTLDPDLARELIYHDCAAVDAKWALAHHDPQAFPPMDGAEPTEMAWRARPWTYAVCTQDRGWRPDAVKAFTSNATSVVEWPTGHVPLISRPDLVAGLLIELAEQYAE